MHKSVRFSQTLTLLLALTCGPVLHGQKTAASAANPIYAQYLADETVKRQSGLLDCIFHVTPPHEADNMAVAAYTEKERGAKSGEDDLGVMTSGKPLIEVQKDGVRIGVLVPLKDQAGRTIGALGLMYRYNTGEHEELFLHRSEAIRDQLARQIGSHDALFAKSAMTPKS